MSLRRTLLLGSGGPGASGGGGGGAGGGSGSGPCPKSPYDPNFNPKDLGPDAPYYYHWMFLRGVGPPVKPPNIYWNPGQV